MSFLNFGSSMGASPSNLSRSLPAPNTPTVPNAVHSPYLPQTPFLNLAYSIATVTKTLARTEATVRSAPKPGGASVPTPGGAIGGAMGATLGGAAGPLQGAASGSGALGSIGGLLSGMPGAIGGIGGAIGGLLGGGSAAGALSTAMADSQQQAMQNFMFQQQVNQESQKFATLSSAQKAMHDAVMSMLNSIK